MDRCSLFSRLKNLALEKKDKGFLILSLPTCVRIQDNVDGDVDIDDDDDDNDDLKRCNKQ